MDEQDEEEHPHGDAMETNKERKEKHKYTEWKEGDEVSVEVHRKAVLLIATCRSFVRTKRVRI